MKWTALADIPAAIGVLISLSCLAIQIRQGMVRLRQQAFRLSTTMYTSGRRSFPHRKQMRDYS